jgi:flagellar assembly protein FliH
LLEPAGVATFEYQEAGALEPATGGAALADRAMAQPRSPGQVTAPELELKLAEARVGGIQQGLQQAQQSFEAEFAKERAKMAAAIRSFVVETGQYYSRAEVELVGLSLAIAAKILHRESQVDRMLVAALVKVALDKLRHGTTATVRVRPEEVSDWNRYFEGGHKGEIKVEVIADASVEAHDCVLETQLGSTRLGLDAQLKEIEQGFFDLLAQRPDNK